MAQIPYTIASNGPNSYEYTWAGTPPYRAYREDGSQLNQDKPSAASVILTSGNTQPEVIAVFDATDTTTLPNSKLYPATLSFQWYAEPGMANLLFFQIEQFVDAAWIVRGFTPYMQTGYHNFTSAAITDDSTVGWRIIPTDTANNQGAVVPFTVGMVTLPAVPEIAVAYAAGDITVTEV